jgi:hypothetical protein
MANTEQLQPEQEVQEQHSPQKEEQKPVFEEIKNIDMDGALNILIQAANLAQNAGRLSVRDSVLLGKAIDVVRPGSV